MKVGEFDVLMHEIHDIFSKPTPKGDAVTRVWNQAQRLPSSSIPAIIRAFENRDEFPRNLGKAIMAAAYTADGGVSAECKGCLECDTGTIYIKRVRDGRTITAASACATCHPTAEHKATQQQLRASGWTIDNPKRGNGIHCSPERVAEFLRGIRPGLGAVPVDYGCEVPF